MTGKDFPILQTPVPGPHSRELTRRLAASESPNVTYVGGSFPVFWKRALGANIEDVDGNVYIDLSAAFGVQGIGHSHPTVASAIKEQADLLMHGMGDVHPTELKVRLAEKLASLTPGDLSQVIFSSSGAEAVESALKTARLYTGKAGVIAFEGAYHGLTYGTLSVTHRKDFSEPFRDQLSHHVTHVPFPDRRDSESLDRTLGEVRRILSTSRVGALLTEPILGRGGIVIPPTGFLAGLKKLCEEFGALLILDEIMTGFGRTGAWFACNHENVVPDLMALGKGMTGGFPISACIGSSKVMAAWGLSGGEAIHTSTFLGSPLGAASALAAIRVIGEEHLVERSRRLGTFLMSKLEALKERYELISDVRGVGLMAAVELIRDGAEPAAEETAYLVNQMTADGVMILPCGTGHNVLSFTPPFVITEAQLTHAVSCLEKHIAHVSRKRTPVYVHHG